MYQEKQQPGSMPNPYDQRMPDPYAQQMPNPYAQQGPANGQHVINQPGMTQQMGIRNGALDAGLQRNAEGEREWKHGLFGCSDDCGNFCLSFWCPCLTYNQNMTRQRALENTHKPHPEGGEYIGADCGIWFGIQCISGCCGPALQISSRGKLRKRYGIKGGFLGDCLAAFCCYPCELTQSSQELTEEETFLRQ